MMSGAVLGLWSAVLFGLSTPVAKSLLGGGVSPWLLAGLLYLGSGVGLVGILALRRIRGGPRREASLRPADAPWLLAVVLSGGVAGPVLLMFGLTTLPGSSAALLLTFEGLATMAIAWFVFREPVGPRILAGAAMIVAGAALVAWSGSGGISFGALLVLAACLAWAVDNNLTRKLSTADPVQIAAVKGLVAGAVNLAIAFGSGAELPGFTTTAAALAVGLCGYGISLVLFVLALRSVGAARTGAYFSTAPFIGATFGVAFLNEPVTVTLVVGGVLIAAGVVIHVLESHEHEHAHKALEHDHRHVHDEHHGHIHVPSDPPGVPHAHWHRHEPMVHRHPHFPDIHHRHRH